MIAELQQAIEKETLGIDLKALEQAAQELSASYRGQPESRQRFMSTDARRAAYTIFRMPATYAAIARVLDDVKKQLPNFSPKTLLDLGSGPGTVLWAAAEAWPDLLNCTLVEQDKDLILLAQRLASNNPQLLQKGVWEQKDLRQQNEFKKHDVAVLSYVLGELDEQAALKAAAQAWEASQLCIIIEPGTMHGFSRIRAVRQALIDTGAHIIAPCPHRNACPMPANDWCHFAQRLERSFYHRYVKGASLGYEDEKFSYVAAAKMEGNYYDNRILRHPKKHSGHITFELCTAKGIVNETISRKQGEAYKQAKKLEWGDIIKR